MFGQARIKLTIWYVGIILIISTFFSVAFYNSSTREIDRIVDRLQFEKIREESGMPSFRRPPGGPSIEELLSYKERMRLTLLIVNGIILLFSAGAAYILSGRTLRPIKVMVDEQNQFISSASHELRTPLATLRTEMEGHLLEKEITDQQARNLIKSNLEEIERLQGLSNNLLRITQVQELTNSTFEDISVSEVLEAAIAKVLPLARKKNILLVTKTKESIISGDKLSIVEVFVILIDNAIKYSPKKSEVSVVVHKNQKQVVIAIKDNGIGIAEKDKVKIFERFYRADSSRTVTDGYGLGLSIARKTIEKHNGSIQVTSTLNKGSLFEVKFPRIA
jgi:signal transduction histidine kinase